ncbi:zinc-binding metallopeptidase family protein [Nocardia sp. CDC160]|uniref:zinc-binding metallopeptidase family protein n=1 Tax=Nocardia sp. CDC160 TaxID=3112166 RepID=UPI002DBB6C0D|nr:putative zinc-binding metallopeptidase [Nocardia sp. CDC160]MEC3913905.1 putative zinc-binding metallopeptidase [Nocardia sp. CDC160]
MRDFACPRCGQQLAFENTVCLGCGSDIGFSLEARALLPVDPEKFVMCANQFVAQCNWLVPADTAPSPCESCRLTRARPATLEGKWLTAFGEAEAAKRRLVVELTELGLPLVDRATDPELGLAFDLLSSAEGPVTTGHEHGVITLDLAEGDDLHRERLRVEMAEPYRTLLGHFRHEIGHYYQVLLLTDGETVRFHDLFGDPFADYQEALDRHYAEGAPPGWENTHVSSYATMHPVEDWAETFAHYLHIRDTLDTAAAFGFAPAGATLDRLPAGNAAFDRIIELWLPLVWALNMMNRAMGHRDPYPFVLADPVLDKMRLIHELCAAAARG